jgi:hypothetical protein
MKSKLSFSLLLLAIFLLPGCYTVLLIEPTDESVSFNPDPPMPYDPGPLPTPAPPYDPVRPHPHPTPPLLPPAVVITQPATTPPSPDDRRTIQTGRGSINSNPAPARTQEGVKETRDTGARRH